jgi:hypothetical protein
MQGLRASYCNPHDRALRRRCELFVYPQSQSRKGAGTYAARLTLSGTSIWRPTMTLPTAMAINLLARPAAFGCMGPSRLWTRGTWARPIVALIAFAGFSASAKADYRPVIARHPLTQQVKLCDNYGRCYRAAYQVVDPAQPIFWRIERRNFVNYYFYDPAPYSYRFRPWP